MGKSVSFHLWSQMDWRPSRLSLGSRGSDSLLATRTSGKLCNSLGEKDLMSWHISLAIDPLLIYFLSLVSIYYPYRLILFTAWRFKHHFSWSKKTVFLDRPLEEESLKLAQKMKHFFFPTHWQTLYVIINVSVWQNGWTPVFLNQTLPIFVREPWGHFRDSSVCVLPFLYTCLACCSLPINCNLRVEKYCVLNQVHTY